MVVYCDGLLPYFFFYQESQMFALIAIFKNFEQPDALRDSTRIVLLFDHSPSLSIHLDWWKWQQITALKSHHKVNTSLQAFRLTCLEKLKKKKMLGHRLPSHRPLSLWWKVIRYPRTQGHCDIRVFTVYLPKLSEIPIYRPTRLRGWTAGWAVRWLSSMESNSSQRIGSQMC